MNIIGVDLGDGQSSISLFQNGDTNELNIRPNRALIYSTLCRVGAQTHIDASDNIIRDGLQNQQNQFGFNINFKGALNEETQPRILEDRRRNMSLFIKQLLNDLCRNNTQTDYISNPNYAIFFACPSGWDDEAVRLYEDLINSAVSDLQQNRKLGEYQTSDPLQNRIKVVRESDAAFVASRDTITSELQLANGENLRVLVIDYGSSTIDYTYYGDGIPVHGGSRERLGASNVEKILLYWIFANETNARDCFRESSERIQNPRLTASIITHLLRKEKENFFKDVANGVENPVLNACYLGNIIRNLNINSFQTDNYLEYTEDKIIEILDSDKLCLCDFGNQDGYNAIYNKLDQIDQILDNCDINVEENLENSLQQIKEILNRNDITISDVKILKNRLKGIELFDGRKYITRVKEDMRSFKDVHITDQPIDYILITGGAARMSFVRDIVSNIFAECHNSYGGPTSIRLDNDTNLDYVVSRGTAKFGHYLFNSAPILREIHKRLQEQWGIIYDSETHSYIADPDSNAFITKIKQDLTDSIIRNVYKNRMQSIVSRWNDGKIRFNRNYTLNAEIKSIATAKRDRQNVSDDCKKIWKRTLDGLNTEAVDGNRSIHALHKELYVDVDRLDQYGRATVELQMNQSIREKLAADFKALMTNYYQIYFPGKDLPENLINDINIDVDVDIDLKIDYYKKREFLTTLIEKTAEYINSGWNTSYTPSSYNKDRSNYSNADPTLSEIKSIVDKAIVEFSSNINPNVGFMDNQQVQGMIYNICTAFTDLRRRCEMSLYEPNSVIK